MLGCTHADWGVRLQTAFWILIAIITNTWLGYPVVLRLVSLRGREHSVDRDEMAAISVVIATHNEEEEIAARVEDLLGQGYPEELMEVIVASDGSRDGTNEIVTELARAHPETVRLLALDRGGKSRAQNKAIAEAVHSIIVLTDAEARFGAGTLDKMARAFNDPDVGCVTGLVRLTKTDGVVSASQGLYWRYETWMRRLESRANLLHTASGAVMAFRKQLFAPLEDRYGDDCVIPLDILLKGGRVVLADDAIAYDSFPSDMRGEFNARVRMTLRNITCTLSRRWLLNPFSHPLLAYSIFSHKLSRWLTPYFLLSILALNVVIAGEGTVYTLSLFAQLVIMVLSLAGLAGNLAGVRVPVAAQAFSFLLANAGFMMGTLKAVTGRKMVLYGDTKGCDGV